MVDFGDRYKKAIAAAKAQLEEKKIREEREKIKTRDSNVLAAIEKAISRIKKAILGGDDKVLVAQSEDKNFIVSKLKESDIPYNISNDNDDTVFLCFSNSRNGDCIMGFLGCLMATGVAFAASPITAKEVTGGPIPKAKRMLRLFDLSTEALKTCKLGFETVDGQFEAPPIASTIKEEEVGKLTFVSQEVKLTDTSLQVRAVILIDDQGIVVARRNFTRNYTKGDVITMRYDMNVDFTP